MKITLFYQIFLLFVLLLLGGPGCRKRAAIKKAADTGGKRVMRPVSAVNGKRPAYAVNPKSSPGKRIGEQERLGEYLIVGLDAPDFMKLSRRERIFSYYLYRAAIAGNDILYMQNHRDALKIKRLMETLYRHHARLAADTRRALHRYLKRVWINHGQYEHRSNLKFVPKLLTMAMLRRAMATAWIRGERFTFLPGDTRELKFEAIRRSIFDKYFEPVLSTQSRGGDIIAKSAVNFYDPGITLKMIKALPAALRNRLNVRFALSGGKVVPQIYKVGGVFSNYLTVVVGFLKKALPFAGGEHQALSLRHLIKHLTGGAEGDFRKYSIEWLRSNNRVDYLASFVEQLKDPRGVIGNFEGAVLFRADSLLVKRLARQAAYFEKQMPWPDKYKREKIAPPVSNVMHAVIGTGDMGPVPWAGYNLPNYADIRRDVGSKNVIILNIMNSGSKRDQNKIIREFYLTRYHGIMRRHGKLVRRWQVYMHEVIGHGSGKPDSSLKGDPRNIIGRSFSPLEECRADLVALYHIADPKLVAIGAFPPSERLDIIKTMYVKYLQSHMISLHKVGPVLKSAHRRGDHLIFSYLLWGGESGKEDYGVELRTLPDKKQYIFLENWRKMRQGIAKLLGKLQVIKSTGNAAEANRLFDRFGTHYDRKMKEQILRRAKRLNLPRQSVMVYPRLVPVLKGKRLVDVQIRFDEDLTAQQLRFSRQALSPLLD